MWPGIGIIQVKESLLSVEGGRERKKNHVSKGVQLIKFGFGSHVFRRVGGNTDRVRVRERDINGVRKTERKKKERRKERKKDRNK